MANSEDPDQFLIHKPTNLNPHCLQRQDISGVHYNIGLDKSRYQGPVVQSVVSLTRSLRVISLTVLADSIHNILIFFAEKM